MDNLFSHAPGARDGEGRDEPNALEPLVNIVVVPGTVSHAFAGFTDHTHLWWPLGEYGVFGEASYVEFEENLILETADDGRTSIWGILDEWNPPFSFHASWHPGNTALWSTELLVAFRHVEHGTEVRLFHDGWEGAEDPAGTRVHYAEAWPLILSRFARFMGA